MSEVVHVEHEPLNITLTGTREVAQRRYNWISAGLLRGDAMRTEMEHNEDFIRAVAHGSGHSPGELKGIQLPLDFLMFALVNHFQMQVDERTQRIIGLYHDYPTIMDVYSGYVVEEKDNE